MDGITAICRRRDERPVSSSQLSLAGSLERGSSPRSTLESFGVPSLSVCAPCPPHRGCITPDCIASSTWHILDPLLGSLWSRGVYCATNLTFKSF